MTDQDNGNGLAQQLRRREAYRDAYTEESDPISMERHLWQAATFRHLTHLVPGETILEIGAGQGSFTEALLKVSKGRNPITAVRFNDDGDFTATGNGADNVTVVSGSDFPAAVESRKFNYVVLHNMLDRETVTFLMSAVYDLLQPGGRVVCAESNPWNPVFAIRQKFRKWRKAPLPQTLVNRLELYELISDIGFVRVFTRFNDFVYAPLPKALMWVFRNTTIVLENMPLVQNLAGRILIQAQKPPRDAMKTPASLCSHRELNGRISVVIPCHNEEMNVGPLVDGLLSYYGDYIHEIVLVDDNSTDGTQDVIRETGERVAVPVKLVARTPPNGVGYAIKEGLQAATGDYILSMDCDFQDLLPELEDMFDAIADGADVAVGSRFSRHSVLINYPFGKIIANRMYHLCFNILFREARRDLTNNLKLMRRELAERLDLREGWFAVNAEVGLQLALMDGPVLREVPISWVNRTFDQGHSSFKVLASGGGYARVLFRLFRQLNMGSQRIRPDIEPPGKASGT
ncbi:MAG: glycosyltransferase [Rhodospirillales bacterium]